MKLEHEFIILNADSSNKYLVVKGFTRVFEDESHDYYEDYHKYRVFNIEEMLTCSDPSRKFDIKDLNKKLIFDSEKYEHLDVKDVAGIEKYTYDILEIKLNGDKLI